MFDRLLPFLSLFTSISTILCCALPIILVMLGFGAVFATLTANFPIIVWLGERADYLFILATILLLIAWYFIFIKPQTCPADKKLAELCQKTQKFNKITWIISVVILGFSAFFKYILIFLAF